VWAALGTSNLGQVELPAFVRELTIAADHDEAGLKAAREGAEAYRARGLKVRVFYPDHARADFNDLMG
jgi:putative DNA primase/helicase